MSTPILKPLTSVLLGAMLLSACSQSGQTDSGPLAAAATVSLPVGEYRSFQVTTPGLTDRSISHAGSLGNIEVTGAGSSDLIKQSATWKIVAGLSDANCTSFQSLNFPGDYLRHAGSRIRKNARDGSVLFDKDATFCARPGLSGVGVSLESKNYPGRYVRHFGSELWLARQGGPLPSDAAASFAQNSSWNVTSPWAPDPANPCGALTWKTGTNYPLGTVVKYPANGLFYKVVNVVSGGTDMTDPTISTYFWQPTTCAATNPTPAPTPTPIPAANYLATYYATFAGTVPRLRDIDPNYNLVYLFAATNVGGAPVGTLQFAAPPDGNGAWTNWVSDLQYARSVQKRKMLLSVGGAGNAISFTDRTVSTTFVNSVDKLYSDWGGFDGLDFNTFEGDAAPNTSEMIWVGQELKRRHPGFLVSAPPAPWNPVDQNFCKDMLSAGALDYCAPQYYDGPQLSDPAYLQTNIKIWMDLLGPSHVMVGFGVNNDLLNYWKIEGAVSAFKAVKAQYPGTVGAFDWRLDWDAAQGYPFAKQFAPLVK
ncbi:AbfB domain-containing protein [Deinococcus sp.]|uniref:AbfB domain-containing protein n=1 Tax=Deinococcus sp. TaxID=47478 RepID=UPI0025E1C3AF|nr:AbfB domain-containing protein [Deinococcus sp.]